MKQHSQDRRRYLRFKFRSQSPVISARSRLNHSGFDSSFAASLASFSKNTRKMIAHPAA